jgi:putative chitinase
MTPEILSAATGCTPDNAKVFADPITQAMAKFGVSTPQRQAPFLANAAHESGRFASLTENLNYSVDVLLKMFGRHRISEADARAYGRLDDPNTKKVIRPANQEAIANCIYGCDWAKQALGNTQPGDGWRFRGRGIFQNTGRSNYARARDNLRHDLGSDTPDFEDQPELLATPLWGSLAAGMFWYRMGCNKYADQGSLDGVSDLINLGRVTPAYGDSNGFDDRKALYERARKALGC